MSRKNRQFSNSGMYHVLFRGINHCHIFEEDKDYEVFLNRLLEVKTKTGFKLYAYCLMSNHAHLIIHENEMGGIVSIMRKLLTPYAGWFNRKYQRVGSLVANRYKSECINDDAYLLTLLRYIHNNPVKAGIAKRPEDYKWSSYKEYTGSDNKITDTDFICSLFSESRATAITMLTEYHCIASSADDSIETLERDAVSDNDIRLIVINYMGGKEPNELAGYSKPERDDILKKLRRSGLSIRQIERATGISRGIIANCR